jgi:hypothetical protein
MAEPGRDARLHGADRDPDARGDLGTRQAFEVRELENLALIGAQLSEHPADARVIGTCHLALVDDDLEPTITGIPGDAG